MYCYSERRMKKTDDPRLVFESGLDSAFHHLANLFQINSSRSFITRTHTNRGPLQRVLGIMNRTDRSFFRIFRFSEQSGLIKFETGLSERNTTYVGPVFMWTEGLLCFRLPSRLCSIMSVVKTRFFFWELKSKNEHTNRNKNCTRHLRSFFTGHRLKKLNKTERNLTQG